MLKYETLLDLSRQRLRQIVTSPTHTREARHEASRLLQELEQEIEANVKGHPIRTLVEIGEITLGLVA